MDNRDAITAFIDDYGAIHKSQLQRQLGIAWGVLSHHLNLLSRDGLVVLQYWGKSSGSSTHQSRKRRDSGSSQRTDQYDSKSLTTSPNEIPSRSKNSVKN
jgi:DNA-binding transcriptional ArsR family regulator